MDRRQAIGVLMSDVGLLGGKLPEGRFDDICRMEQLPPSVEKAVQDRLEGVILLKGSKVWRQVRDFFLELKIPGRRRKRKAA